MAQMVLIPHLGVMAQLVIKAQYVVVGHLVIMDQPVVIAQWLMKD